MWFLSSRKNRRSNSAPARLPRTRLCLEMLEDRCVPSAGQLDPTFGTGGLVATTLQKSTSDVPANILVQPDGKIIAVGAVNASKTNYIGLARYNSNGSLDTSFGTGGIVVADAGHSASRAALQPDGKIDVIDKTWTVFQFNANGTVDKTFGNKGQMTIPFSGNYPHDLVIQPPAAGSAEGKIVVVGDVNSLYGVVGLARLNPGGSLDTTFGSGGTVTATFGPGTKGYTAHLNSVALQSNGQIVVSGYLLTNTSLISLAFLTARYNSNGSLDASFGGGGIVLTSIAAQVQSDAWKVLVQPSDGKIVALGDGFVGDFQTGVGVGDIVRYNPDGSLDTSFGTGGIVINPTNAGFDDAAIGNDGSIIATSSQDPSGADPVVLARYFASSTTINGVTYPAGGLDPTFGTSGQVFTSLYKNGLAFVAIQADGKILVTGDHTANAPQQFNLARFLPSEPEIASFTAGTNPVTSGSSETLTASSITDGNAGATIAQVAFYLDSNNDGILETRTDTLLGYGTQTSPGVWTYTFTVTQATGNYTLFAQAEDSYGVFGDPVAITLQVA